MNKSYYKVSFFDNRNLDSEPISLVFRKVEKSPSDSFVTNLIDTIRNYDTEKFEFITIKNIKNVLELSDSFSLSKFSDFTVVLFENGETDKKKGFLIGNKKEIGLVIIGYWPFYSKENLSAEELKNICNSIISDLSAFDRILLTKQI
ncbi:MAG: hypothetical protein EU550_03760 [Promethearchaeota archaeon]|nr:MAG: hypothetical protein EU550_03760 [Candidatus Lokiarchaeota archaeon]